MARPPAPRHARPHRPPSRPDLPAPGVVVRAPGVAFEYGDQRPFHSASIGKTFTAVLVGRLVEQGLFAFETPIGALARSVDLAALPATPGADLARDVTIEHLLSHRSGLPDAVQPPRGHDTACSIEAVGRDPDRTWSIREVLEQTRHLPPVGPPGERFGYSDSGYALLLALIEDATGQNARDLLHTHVFAPSGMSATHHPHDTATKEELAGLDIAPMWFGRTDVSRSPALSLGSVDGGAVTTATDLLRFQTALHERRLVSDETLSRMTRRRSRLRAGIHYGAGFVTIRFGELMPLVLRGLPEPVGGLGLTATHAFHYPEQNADVVLDFHSTRAMNQSFRVHIAIARQLACLR